jgi:hypothetical protein
MMRQDTRADGYCRYKLNGLTYLWSKESSHTFKSGNLPKAYWPNCTLFYDYLAQRRAIHSFLENKSDVSNSQSFPPNLTIADTFFLATDTVVYTAFSSSGIINIKG